MTRRLGLLAVGIVAGISAMAGTAGAQNSPPPTVVPTVLGAQIERPPTLPVTGSDVGTALYVGAGLAGVGTVLVVGARRRRQPTAA